MTSISIKDKKIIGIYANCQGLMIEYFLKTIFKKCSFHYFANYNMITNPRLSVSYYKKELRQCDVFIYQPLNKHGEYNADNDGIFKYLKKRVIKISFPYIYNNSLWDLKKLLNRDSEGAILEQNSGSKGLIWDIFNKEVIENIIENNKDISLNELIEMYKKKLLQVKLKIQDMFD